MIYTELTKKAMKLCFEAHKDQTDKSGLPYVFHPFHLAEQMPDEITTAVALLHDVAEDAHITPDALAETGFPPAVTEAVDRLTRREGVPYLAYVAAVKSDPVAKTVKLADLRHNSDLTRLDAVTKEDLRRVEKYRQAMVLLESPDPPEPRPGWQTDCCCVTVPQGSGYCPCCGRKIETHRDVPDALFDPEDTVWACECGGSEPLEFLYCSRCGARRPF